MTPSNLAELLQRTIPAGHPVLVTGSPGIGKSDIITQAATGCDADIIISHPVVSDPTDAKGLPWLDKTGDCATFLPFGDLSHALKATKRTVWFLDDLGQATPAVQASFMQLILARRVNGHRLPDCVTFVAATNRSTDRAGVTGILEPVKSRFVTIIALEPSLDDWGNWALSNGIPPHGVAFLRFRPDLFNQFRPSADMSQSPTPRTWANLFRLEALKLPATVEAEAMAGSVGQGEAAEYLAFRAMAESLVTVDEVLIHPQTATIPTKPAELYAISTALACRATVDNIDRVAIYCNRLMDAKHGEFATLVLRDATRRTAAILKTGTFQQIACSPLGKLITGIS